MMKRLLSLCFFLAALNASAQPYRNEWIAFNPGQPWSSQQYFRISVWQEGIYRVSYNDLQNNGVPVSSWFQVANYQLFHKGREQFIRVIDQNSDNLFTAGDYLEFFGEKNDGELDAFLYDSIPSHPNPYYSLFNDTASYFLTYNPFVNGRRMPVENDQNFGAYPAAPYGIKEQLTQYTADYNLGNRDGNDIADNSYTSGEGYNSVREGHQSFIETNFSIQKLVPGFTPEAKVTVMGGNANWHPYEIRGNTVPFISEAFDGYEFHVKNFTPSNIANGNYIIRLQPLPDVNSPTNRNYMQVGYMHLRYSRSFDYTGETFPQHFNVEGAGQQKVLVQLSGVSLANPVLYLVGGDTIRRIILTQNGSNFQALIPVFGSERELYLVDDNSVLTTAAFTIGTVNSSPDPAAFARFTNFQVQGAGKEFLIVSNKKIWLKAQDYTAYRASTGHNPFLADVDELYDQFAWGIVKHPFAIRNYSDFMIDNGNGFPKWLYLLGKSVLSMNARSGTGYALNLVPTYGEPASDQMYSSKLNTPDFKPELSTGRLSAQDDDDVQNYLDKVQAHELLASFPPQEWMKHVLHFGGGTNIDEQNLLGSKLKVYEQIVEDTLFGGQVFTFLKNSSAPIQINQSQYLQDLIDSGCTMMTFYGHAAGSTFDISTDAPENYNNKDKYPVVLAQSCFVGDIHTTSRLLNERFVLTKDRGSIGFIAVPDKGIIDPLDDYSTQLHKNIFQLNYGKSIGEDMKQTVADIILDDFARKSVCMNMTLHGDPALVLNQYEKPDYAIEDPNIFFDPAQVTTDLDSFTVKFAVSNLGRNINQPLDILVSRKFPNNTTKDSIITVPYVTYRDTFGVKLPVDLQYGPGINLFTVTLDVYDKADEEVNFANNIASAPLSIESNDINPVFPSQYAIYPSQTVKLRATTANLFAGPRNYRFEIDTSIFFSSSLLQSTVVNNSFGIVEWQVPGNLNSDVVYFWRVANDSITNPDTLVSKKFQWRNSSFMVKPGIDGWSQAHYHQLLQSDLINIERDDAQRAFEFVQSQYTLVATHNGNVPSFDINGVNIDYGGCHPIPQIAVVVIDSIDFEHPWTADTCIPNRFFGNYNTYNCNTGIGCGNRTRADNFFLFNTQSPGQMDSLILMLNHPTLAGQYILSWSLFNVDFSQIPNVVNAYSSLGATDLQGIVPGEKFLLFLKRENPSSAIVEKDLSASNLRIDYSFSRAWDKGFTSSTEIGPALQWNNVHWDFNSIEAVSSPDSVLLQVIGIDNSGNETLLKDSLVLAQQPVDISMVSAVQYPKLRLKSYQQDLVNRTAPQLNYWQVYYEPVPEGAIDPRFYTFYKDSLQEGDSVRFSIAFANISNRPMDTLTVDYFLFDNSNARRNIATLKTARNLPVDDSVMTTVQFSTEGLIGKNTLWVEVNPRLIQPEQYHFNNLASHTFYVTRDITNPLLDVTFDGNHILNGDLISAKPGILIQLLDENKFLALNDTSNYRVSLKWPDGSIKYLHFESAPDISTAPELLRWTPAVLPKNSFKIAFNPHLLQDGVYEMQIQASDISGNLSGTKDYKIQFEVINRSSITEVVNYPNPFSTSTRFVFVLTGSEIPSDFRIQIMTVTGKIVREVSRAEIGDIHIGKNITDFAWDGKDQFGDQLANGVYLYRVLTKINDSAIEKRETAADSFFKKGWGKMYLMR